MCGRYGSGTDAETLARRFKVAPAPGVAARWAIEPAQSAPVVFAAPERRMALKAWGLVPAWAEGPAAKPQINARAESLADKPYFREAFRWRRCLVPADGWFEKPKRGADKSMRWFSRRDGAAFAFAGLWEPSGFAIVTVEPNPLVARVHDRMPAVLSPDDEELWLDPKAPPSRLSEALRPFPSDLLRVDSVGEPIADAPSARAPIASPQGELF